MFEVPPRVSFIASHPAQSCSYGYWTKIIRIDKYHRWQYMLHWLEENTTERVVIGWTWLYFESEQDATFFNLTH